MKGTTDMQKSNMCYLKILPLLTAALLLTGCDVRYEYAEPKSYDRSDITRESAGIRLEDDYYGYQNFDFLWNNDIPANMYEYSYWMIASGQTDDILTGEIRAIAMSSEEYPSGSDEQKIKDLYLQYLDADTRNSVGLAPLEKGYNVINSAQSIDEFVQSCGAVYTEYGCTVLPAPYYSRDHYDSSKYSVIMDQMKLFYTADELLNSKDSAVNLQKSMTAVLEMSGHENADALAYDAVTMLLDVAGSTSDIEKMRIDEIYNIYTREELSALFANIDTEAMLDSFGVGDTESFVILDPAQMTKINSLLTDENLPVWKALAECMLIYTYKDFLPEQYSGVVFDSVDRRTDEEKAVSTVKQFLAGETGNIYARKYGDADTVSAVRKMTEDICNAYRKCIEGSELLSESERTQCLAKIDDMTLNIGFPDEGYHTASVVSGSLLESAVSIISMRVKENLALSGSVPSSEDWSMVPQTFNALYQPQSNSITIPMALFNAPFFDVNGEYYTNIGGLGSIIAHEIGHAFDPQGILYDEHGNYRPERIGSERKNNFTSAVEEYFGSRMIMDTFYIDGRLTALENAADLGGMQVISSMTDDPDELHSIFESYAKMWATLSYDSAAAEQITDDVHSPAEIRVNAVLSSVDEFYVSYDISENDGMYLPPDKRVRVW